MTIHYHPAVEAELREIQRYYEEHLPGLGVQFINDFERQVLMLAARPERRMVVTADIRRCLMKRFPYVISFRRVGAESIRVTVIKHQRRHPHYGRARWILGQSARTAAVGERGRSV